MRIYLEATGRIYFCTEVYFEKYSDGTEDVHCKLFSGGELVFQVPESYCERIIIPSFLKNGFYNVYSYHKHEFIN